MTLHCSVNYNEAYLIVLQNGCLAIGLGDEDLSYGWLETVALIAPDMALGERLEFNWSIGHTNWYCKHIHNSGRFMGYVDPTRLSKSPSCEKVLAPVDFVVSKSGLKALNFEAQLQWLRDHYVWDWSFYPVQGLTDNQIKIIWMFSRAQDAMLFKLAWS